MSIDLRPSEGAPPRLDRDVQARIGEQLRTMYDGLLQQPIPQRFVDLLKAMDEAGQDTGSKEKKE